MGKGLPDIKSESLRSFRYDDLANASMRLISAEKVLFIWCLQHLYRFAHEHKGNVAVGGEDNLTKLFLL